ncbi:hypothetical protein C8R44DRAFT_736603 [Mycena epipterygia]|nr:hypothetical protein C8R44DRAFT_736603 [Mycena epipterygia]
MKAKWRINIHSPKRHRIVMSPCAAGYPAWNSEGEAQPAQSPSNPSMSVSSDSQGTPRRRIDAVFAIHNEMRCNSLLKFATTALRIKILLRSVRAYNISSSFKLSLLPLPLDAVAISFKWQRIENVNSVAELVLLIPEEVEVLCVKFNVGGAAD